MRFSIIRAGLMATCIPTIQSAPVESSNKFDLLSRSGLAVSGLRAEIPSSPNSFVTYTGKDIEDIRNQALASAHPGFTPDGFDFSILGPGFAFDGLAALEDVDDSRPTDDLELDGPSKGNFNERDDEALDRVIGEHDIKEHKPQLEDEVGLSAWLQRNRTKTKPKPAGFVPPYILQRLRKSSLLLNTTITGHKNATKLGSSRKTAAIKPSAPAATPSLNCDGPFKKAQVKAIHEGLQYLHKLPGHAVIAPSTCQRVSCSWKAGIYVCNETPTSTSDSKKKSKAEDEANTTRISFKDIATGANNILRDCWMDWGGWSSGKYTQKDGVTSVIIRGGAYGC